MIDYANFTSISGDSVDFNDDFIPFNSFTTDVELRSNQVSKSGQEGDYPTPTYAGRRTYHCEGDILEFTSAGYWTRRLALIAAVQPKPHLATVSGLLTMRLTGMEEDVQTECEIDGWPEIPLGGASPSRSPYQINFKAFDPKLYGDLRSVLLNYSINDNSGGRTYNKTYPKTYATLGTPPDAIVTNSGNTRTFPIVTIHGPVTDPIVTMSRSDGETFYMRLDGLNLGSVDNYVVIDTRDRTVFSNTGDDWYGYAINTDWFALEPATSFTQSLRFAGSSGTSSAYAEIDWRNAYMI